MQAKIFEYFSKKNNTSLLLCSDAKEADYADDVLRYLGYESFVFPDFRALKGDDLRPYKEELTKLLSKLRDYYESKSEKKIIVSPFRTITHPLPKPKLFKTIKLSFGDFINLQELKVKLLHWGYAFVDIVEEKAEVSFRGDIIDIYPIDSKTPYRISLFDDQIESIRAFFCETQKSDKKEIEEIALNAALFALDEKSYKKIIQKIELLESDAFVKDMASTGFWVLDELAENLLLSHQALFINDTKDEIEEYFSFDASLSKTQEILKNIEILKSENLYKDIEVADLNALLSHHKDKKITVIANNEAVIKQYDIFNEIDAKFIYKDYILNILGQKDLIISLNKKRKRKKRKRATIVLDDLKPGDYVVHHEYGIGIFKGLTKTRVLGVVRDFVEIVYQGEDKLLIPVENLDMIDRYISEGSTLCVIDKLGKASFSKLKEKAKTKLFEIAKEIIETAAKREIGDAAIINRVDDIELFQNDAGFEYTKDQKEAIEKIFDSLQSSKVMDMLLSGDVGFGKTEVAMNAIFAAVKNGYQAAFIAPTTLLCTQHYKTLKERFAKYSISVEKLNRFTSAKEKSRILKGLKCKTLDVCVGTHSLFGVEFSNLGILILDEEHKFGVKQKEKLKQFKENLHILSMSATPIPRSLNLALSSIKEYSQLLTPPLDREDVRTFVKEYDKSMIKEVILRELRRGGQIFYIHNRIASIEDKKRELLEIAPNLKILVLHSKVPPAKSEKEMLDFENKKYDLLLSTSIVESGIHMPNVNTMIVESAENFGMADLHQLRGRVGRGKRQGYCYFIVENKNSLSEQSKKRLIALESNSYLGSGSVLAYHDLEIRGGGNIIGEAQSGHIKNIGYSLYLKMLEDALNLLLNQKSPIKKSVELKLSVSAYINSDTVSQDRLRLELYRRLSKCENAKEVYEIEEEMIDRFGKLDVMTKQFIEIVVIKTIASKLNITKISSYEQNITIEFENGSKQTLKAPSKDDDDIITTTMKFLLPYRQNI